MQQEWIQEVIFTLFPTAWMHAQKEVSYVLGVLSDILLDSPLPWSYLSAADHKGATGKSLNHGNNPGVIVFWFI